MVKITNGINEYVVTAGAYAGIYSRQGYRIVPEAKPVVQTVQQTAPAVDPNEEMVEKPIGQWSKEEVKDFASRNGIDLSGTKNVAEAKDRVKAWIDQH